MRYYLTALIVAVAFGIPWIVANDPEGVNGLIAAVQRAGEQAAAVIISHNPVTIADLHSDYTAAALPDSPKKIRILVVPGHEPDYGGAEYQSSFGRIKERDLTVELAADLESFLQSDARFQVFASRDANGWTPTFADYFKNGWNDIVAWEQANKEQFTSLVKAGSVRQAPATVVHADAPTDVALRLYGIDKWANENDIDIMIHVHFNDYPGHGSGPGKYTGFAIYIPEKQYENSTTTAALADGVFKRLSAFNPVSDLTGESDGIVPDPDLIALGAFDSVNAASMLVEYSYIYEPQLDDPATRSIFLNDLAYQTYLGIRDFFEPGSAGPGVYGTAALPHTWASPMSAGGAASADVFALQSALIQDGDYPPAGSSLTDCPRTGKYGPCTTEAVLQFQKKHGIAGANGNAGPATVAELNSLFSAR
ncbi:MAG: peptidoglycan-binding protein [Patescibacteria group bacterium]|nr:peptidoglycan-binding protein [Patescibacteria group bacterium]